jgi:hypothetical protein
MEIPMTPAERSETFNRVNCDPSARADYIQQLVEAFAILSDVEIIELEQLIAAEGTDLESVLVTQKDHPMLAHCEAIVRRNLRILAAVAEAKQAGHLIWKGTEGTS